MAALGFVFRPFEHHALPNSWPRIPPPKLAVSLFGGSSAAARQRHEAFRNHRRAYCKMVGKKRPLTNAERQAKWRLAHGHKKAASDASRPKRDLLVTCIPPGSLDRSEVERSGGATLAD